MIKILDGYDKFIKVTKDDTIFLATPIYEGREKTFYKLLDRIENEIKRCDCLVMKVPVKEVAAIKQSRICFINGKD